MDTMSKLPQYTIKISARSSGGVRLRMLWTVRITGPAFSRGVTTMMTVVVGTVHPHFPKGAKWAGEGSVNGTCTG